MPGRVGYSKPSLLLLDEPFANVDAALRDSLGQLLRRVARENGASVLMVTHDQEAALSMADRVVVLEPTDQGGVVVQDAPPVTVYQRPTTETVATLTGACTIIDVTAQGDTASSPFGTLSLLASRQGSGRAMLRPEQLRFVPDDSGDVALQSHQFAAGSYRLHCVGPTGAVHIQQASTEAVPKPGTTGRIEVCAAVWVFPG